MKKHLYLLTLVMASIIITSCSNKSKITIEEKSSTIVVKVAQIKTNGNSPLLSVSGKIQASNSVDLSTRMMGFVDNIHVSVGDKVKKGQLLISINSSDLQAKRAQVNASITEATAAFNNAQKDYDRFNNLFNENSASQKELDDMTANFEMAKARLEAAKQMKNQVNAQFAYTNIRAPFNGIVTSKNAEIGDMANPGMSLISIETPEHFEVITMVPESEISEIKSGTKVDVLVKSIAQTIEGKVTEVSTSAKHTGGQYLVKINLEKTDANILSGMYATVQFPIERSATSELVLIPKDAIVTHGQLSGIYTISESNTALLRWLRLGRDYGDQVEVLSGLRSGEDYIVSAEGKLFNGVKVIIQ